MQNIKSSNKYIKPSNIRDDMGGADGFVDDRMRGIIELLAYVPKDIKSVLDIGFGKGQIPYYFKDRGKKVTSIGLELESYGTDISKARADGIDVIQANVMDMPFDDEAFDCVVASHILEHISDMGLALDEIKRVMSDRGWLVIFIPEYIPYVCAGHVNTGWNLGQLIYVLCLHGWDVRNGKFIKIPGSLCAMVQKSSRRLPPLRGDRGDIQILAMGGYFPFKIEIKPDGTVDGFDARGLTAVNWDDFTGITYGEHSRLYKVIKVFVRILHKIVGRRLEDVSLVIEDVVYPDIINPKIM